MEETGSRLYIHEAVYDRFLAALKTSVEQTTIGPANDPTCNFGPIGTPVCQVSAHISDWGAQSIECNMNASVDS